MLTSSQKAFLVMHQLRRYAGLTVIETQFMHRLDEATYSRILRSISANKRCGMNGKNDVNIQKCIHRLRSGFKQNILKPNSSRPSEKTIEHFKYATRSVRLRLKPPVDDSFETVMHKAKTLCEL